MNQYYHPSSEPLWVDSNWLRENTPWDPDTTPLTTLADNGFFELKVEPYDYKIHSPYVYYPVWDYRVESPYCIQYSTEFKPFPLDEAKDMMQAYYPDYTSEIEAATTSEQLQEIYNSVS